MNHAVARGTNLASRLFTLTSLTRFAATCVGAEALIGGEWTSYGLCGRGVLLLIAK